MRAALIRQFPKISGAYALLIRLEGPLPLPLDRFGAPTLHTGWYVYAGSAFGPGGIAARIGRHLRKAKKPHWHVDHLTNAAADIEALALPGARECQIVERLMEYGDVSIPVSGFGATDCTVCVSHLMEIAPGRLSGVRHCLHDINDVEHAKPTTWRERSRLCRHSFPPTSPWKN